MQEPVKKHVSGVSYPVVSSCRILDTDAERVQFRTFSRVDVDSRKRRFPATHFDGSRNSLAAWALLQKSASDYGWHFHRSLIDSSAVPVESWPYPPKSQKVPIIYPADRAVSSTGRCRLVRPSPVCRSSPLDQECSTHASRSIRPRYTSTAHPDCPSKPWIRDQGRQRAKIWL
jgi:hypothetical protein